jgi:hypothetical protein
MLLQIVKNVTNNCNNVITNFNNVTNNCNNVIIDNKCNKISTKKIINKLLDYMFDYGYCNDDDKKHKEIIQRIKAIIYNLRNFT